MDQGKCWGLVCILVLGVLGIGVSPTNGGEGLLCTLNRITGPIAEEARIGGIEADGDFLYVADWFRGILVFDISDPLAPIEISSLVTGQFTRHLELEDGLLCIADEQSVMVVDIADPSEPRILDTLFTVDETSRLYLDNGILYLRLRNNSWIVIDLRDIENIVVLEDNLDPNRTLALIDDGVALRYDWHNGAYRILRTLDVTDPANPIELGEVDIGFGSRVFASADGELYITGDDFGMKMLDIQDPASPTLIGQSASDFGGQSIQITDEHLYVLGFNSEVYVYKRFGDAPPEYIGIYQFDGYVGEITVSNNTVYAGTFTHGFYILDASEPSNPLLSSTETPNKVTKVDSVGELVFVADHRAGLLIYDASDPTDPVLLSEPYSIEGLRGVRAHGGLVYGLSNSKLFIIDVEDPTLPVVRAQLDVGSHSNERLAIEGDRLYIPYWAGGVGIFDISDTYAPKRVHGIPVEGEIWDVDAVDGFVYVASGYMGLQIFDARKLNDVRLIGSAADATWAGGVLVDDGIAYLMNNVQNYFLYDVADPSSPELIDNGFISFDLESSMQILDQKMYIANGLYLEIWDIADVKNIEWLTMYRTAGNPMGVSVNEDGIAYVADRWGGLQIINASDCIQCAADLNADGHLDASDLSVFVDLFLQSSPSADFTDDDQVDIFDVFAFLVQFENGCP